MGDPTKGLYGKYIVERVDGKPVGNAIVLEFKDPIARVGIDAWAEAMRDNGYELVANDVEDLLYDYD